jgi:single-strand DNA-binding protein
MGINKVILVGNVGRDPETRSLPSGTNLAKFTLATTEPRFKDREQPDKPHTEWHNIVAWGKTAEICQRYVTKGRQLYIEGHIRTRSYDKNGQKTYFTEVHVDHLELLGNRQGGGEAASPAGDPSYGGPADASHGGFPEDDDVPF